VIRRRSCLALVCMALCLACGEQPHRSAAERTVRSIQIEGIRDDRHDVVRWGPEPGTYRSWEHHTNRLIPVYTFGTAGGGPGVDLDTYEGANSVYRSAERLAALYGYLPDATLNPGADYFDQTDLYRIQERGAANGKRYVFLVIFDGMDWQTTRAAAVFRAGRVTEPTGRGTGLHFLDYDASGTTQYGWMVTAPAVERMRTDPDAQRVLPFEGARRGGYDAELGGRTPWDDGSDPGYITGRPASGPVHVWTDSASSATSMCSGIKTYNGAINVDTRGAQVVPIARRLQERGFSIGVVTSVPISHATPAAAYANNVTRQDYQDLARDLLGLRSIAHPESPLKGVDVLIGCGAGVLEKGDLGQGADFVPGNRYLTDEDVRVASERYVVARRSHGKNGAAALAAAAAEAAGRKMGLLGLFGTAEGNLPYRTADGEFDPVDAHGTIRPYPEKELSENPTLAQMTSAALEVLASRGHGMWLMVEAGDVDWANHFNNIDDAIGAVISGDDAVRVITDWVEAHSDWNESLLIVTADHGHYLVLVDPSRLAGGS